ncbi:glycosyltransferase family 2 protein [Microbacter margulisiae]|uniref:Glycosyltransferase involved in cell wall biosynthesis n=1 Tax=Microbacter margulisiae TaxID=1350067 RepID=A0A7W5DQG9_9PORP|nr:glycosyltransferase family 2 protein [Microbacter margulisiae]MBB3187197.1 glycosyltransferase involved in cell wall biosynthesis [Microbacter margulisiae]
MENVLVSIITIVYNGEMFIEKTINSVLEQTYKNIEYIIIDGGSTDSTVEIIKKYQDRLAYWVSEKDNGISDAFNKGIRLAKGKVIGLVNSDDWYETDAIEKIINNYVNSNTIICGNVKLWNNSTHYKIKSSTLDNIKLQMTIWHPGMFCPKEIYHKIGLYDENIRVLMDYDFILRCYLSGVNFKMSNVLISNMRFGGISNHLISESLHEAFIIKNNYFGKKFMHKIEYLLCNVYYHFVVYVKMLIYGIGREN